MHIIPLDSVLTTQMHFSPTHSVPLLLSTLFGGLASKLSLKSFGSWACLLKGKKHPTKSRHRLSNEKKVKTSSVGAVRRKDVNKSKNHGKLLLDWPV